MLVLLKDTHVGRMIYCHYRMTANPMENVLASLVTIQRRIAG